MFGKPFFILACVTVVCASVERSGAGSRVLALVEEMLENKMKTACLPAVTIAYAQTMDGSIAPLDKSRMSISSPGSLLLTHTLRARHDATLVGIDTLLNDSPQLTARSMLPGVQLKAGRQPRPVVLDSRLRIGEMPGRDIRVKQPIVFHCISDTSSCRIKRACEVLEEAGGELVLCRADGNGRCDLQHCLQLLCERFGITSVLIEGGAGVLQSVLEQGLADQAVVTIQPAFLGGYRCLTGQLAQGLVQLSDVAVESVYGDVVLYGRLSANTL